MREGKMKPTFLLRVLKVSSLAIGLAGVASPSQAANLLTNGSFENGTFVPDGNGANSLAVGSTAMTGWTVGMGPDGGVWC